MDFSFLAVFSIHSGFLEGGARGSKTLMFWFLEFPSLPLGKDGNSKNSISGFQRFLKINLEMNLKLTFKMLEISIRNARKY